MKKSIAILVVLVVSVCAFAGNKTPLKKAPTKQNPPVRIELKVPVNKQLMKPAPKPKKVTLAKQAKTK